MVNNLVSGGNKLASGGNELVGMGMTENKDLLSCGNCLVSW